MNVAASHLNSNARTICDKTKTEIVFRIGYMILVESEESSMYREILYTFGHETFIQANTSEKQVPFIDHILLATK